MSDLAAIEAAFADAGLDLQDIFSKSREVILFGSQADDDPSAKDWDVMIISSADPEALGLTGFKERPTRGGRNFKKPPLDIVLVTLEQTTDSDWLGHELAGHVAWYGRWIHGRQGVWTMQTFVSQATLRFKERRVQTLIKGFRRVGRLMNEHFRTKHRTELRHEIRRLRYLREGLPAPSKRVLEERAHLKRLLEMQD